MLRRPSLNNLLNHFESIATGISLKWLAFFSSSFALLATLSTHISSVSRETATYGQTIQGTAQENLFLPFSLVDVLKFASFSILFAAMLLLASKVLLKRKKYQRSDVRWTRHWTLGSFVFLFILWSPYLMSWFPGGIFSDTDYAIQQALGNKPISNLHTIAYVFLWKMCLFVSRALGHDLFAAAVIMQFIYLITMSSAIVYGVYWLRAHGISMFACSLALIFFGLFPLIPQYVVSLWKDTLFSIALFLFSLQYIDAVFYKSSNHDDYPTGISKRTGRHFPHNKTDSSDKTGSVIGLVGSALAVAFTRNNGIYVIAFSLLALAIAQRHNLRRVSKRSVVPLTVILLISVMVQGPIFSKLGLNTSSTVESLGIPIQQIGRTFALDGYVSDGATEYFSTLLPEETWKSAYKPFLVDSLKWNPAFRADTLHASIPEFVKNYLTTGLHNPLRYLEAFLLSNSGFWNPLVGWNENIGYYSLSMWNNVKVTQLDLLNDCLGISFRNVLRPNIFISPAVFAWLLMLSGSVLIILKRPLPSMGLIPALGLWLTLIIASPIAYSLRYCFTFVLLLPIAFALLSPAFSKMKPIS